MDQPTSQPPMENTPYNNDKAQFSTDQTTLQPDVAYPPNGIAQQIPQRNHYPTATPLASLQQAPTPVDCPLCGVREMTVTEYKAGGYTHVSALLCCLCLCLGCVPYIATWFKDVDHKCGSCGGLLAVWHRSGRTEVKAVGGRK